MSNAVEKWIPISELPGHQEADENARVTWDFELPPTVDAERLVLNTRMLGRIQNAAAFSTSHVVSYQGETTQYTPGINGINSDGTAQASMTGQLKKAPKTHTHIHDELAPGPYSERLMHQYFKTATINGLNKAELASTVADGRDTNKSREARWADAIDDALSQSLRESAKEHLLKRQSARSNLLDTAFYGMSIFSLIDSTIDHDVTFPAIMAGTIGSIITMQELFMKHVTGQSLSRDRRWSLAFLSDAQPDRYALASALTRAGTLIQARK